MSAHVVLFHALGEAFAVPVAAVREVVRDAGRRTVPSSRPWVVGVADVRGSILPLVDLGIRLGRGGAGLGGDLLILEAGDSVAALSVERVLGLAVVGDVSPPPAGASPVVAGTAFARDELVVVLEPSALVPGASDGPPASEPDAVPLQSGAYGPVLVARGPWSPALADAATGAAEVVLDEAHGWDGEDVEFLKALPGLRAVRIRHRGIRDVSGIHALGQLRDLEVLTRCRTPIDAGAFPALERCALRWRPRARSVLAAPGLRELVLTHYAARDLREFGGLESLERLELRRGVVERLDGIDALGRLRELRLRELRRLESIDGVERLRLEALELWKCPRVRSRAPATGIPTVVG